MSRAEAEARVAKPRVVAERRLGGAVPLWVHPEWDQRFPWLVQGTTGRGPPGAEFDLGLSGTQPVGSVLGRWRVLLDALGVPSAVHSRQVHRADLWVHRAPTPPGLLLMAGYDGHLTDRPGLLVSVSVADCIPLFLLDPERQALALLHAGWRGVAAGILERALAALEREYGSRAHELWVHCGPSICGRCYEVGPEVHHAVRPDEPAPGEPCPIDLRAAIASRAAARGIEEARTTVSSHCTRCGSSAGAHAASGADFFSYRAGHAQRQMGVMAIRS